MDVGTTVVAEYLYYDLGDVNVNQTLTLVSTVAGPTNFVSSNISSRAHVRGNIARAGINYHF